MGIQKQKYPKAKESSSLVEVTNKQQDPILIAQVVSSDNIEPDDVEKPSEDLMLDHVILEQDHVILEQDRVTLKQDFMAQVENSRQDDQVVFERDASSQEDHMTDCTTLEQHHVTLEEHHVSQFLSSHCCLTIPVAMH